MNRPMRASDLPHHTRDLPRPRQVVPIWVIKPQAKMEPSGIQDSTVRATSSSADSHELHNFRIGGTHVNCTHFQLRRHFLFGDSHVTHTPLPVQRESRDPPPLRKGP